MILVIIRPDHILKKSRQSAGFLPHESSFLMSANSARANLLVVFRQCLFSHILPGDLFSPFSYSVMFAENNGIV